jgi:hypothetical protein
MAANATASAAAAAKAKTALATVIRQKNNENAAKFFAVGIVGMIVLFMVFHWSIVFLKLYELKKNQSLSFLRLPARLSRQHSNVDFKTRKVLTRETEL